MGNHQKNNSKSEASSTGVSQTPQTFHLFPNLPSELQDVIWTLALPRGRLHILSGGGKAPTSTEGLPPPAIARTCYAARAAALRCNPVRELVPYRDTPSAGTTAPNTDTDTVTDTTTTSVWFDGTRDILLIDDCYPHHDLNHRYAALFAAAETVAISEEHLIGREPRHSGFLADLVQQSSSTCTGGSRGGGVGRRFFFLFPRLRRVLVITTRVLVAPESWPQSWGLCDDDSGSGSGSGSPYPYHVVRPFRASESFAVDVMAPTEARILKLLRIEHERWSSRLRSAPAEVESKSGVPGSGGDVDAREEDEVWGFSVNDYNPIDSFHDGGDDDVDDDKLRTEPITRDHIWVQKRWDRLPQFVQAISVKDCDTSEVTCKSTSWKDLV